MKKLLFPIVLFSSFSSAALSGAKPESKVNEPEEYSDPAGAKVGETWKPVPAKTIELQRSIPSVQLTNVKVGKDVEIIFASYEPKDPPNKEEMQYRFRPTILSKAPNAPAHIVVLDKLARYDWVGGASLPAKGYFWGFLEHQVEGTAHAIPIIHSRDGGLSWTFLSLAPKHNFSDLFDSFAMNENGHGYMRFNSIEGETQFYTVETKDFGKSWSKPGEIFNDLTRDNKRAETGCSFGQYAVAKISPNCALPVHFVK